MRKVQLFLMILLISICFSSCKPKEKISYFRYTSYDDVSDVGEKGIYIQGTLKSTDVVEIDGVPYIAARINEGKNKEWLCLIGQAGRYSDQCLKDYIGKKVNCFGDYTTKNYGTPILELELVGDYCINKANANTLIANGENLLATEDYLIAWCNANAPEAIYDEVSKSKKPGTYKSTGIISGITVNESGYIFDLYQKNDDNYYRSSVLDTYNKYLQISDMKQLGEYKEGDAIVIYYVIDKAGNQQDLGFDKAVVDFSLDDCNSSTTDRELIVGKEYTVRNCQVTFSLYHEKKSDNIILWGDVCGNSDEDVAITSMSIALLFYNLGDSGELKYTVHGIVNDTKKFVLMVLDKDEEILTGADENGNVSLSLPQWYMSIVDNVPHDEFKAIIDEAQYDLADLLVEFNPDLASLMEEIKE